MISKTEKFNTMNTTKSKSGAPISSRQQKPYILFSVDQIFKLFTRSIEKPVKKIAIKKEEEKKMDLKTPAATLNVDFYQNKIQPFGATIDKFLESW